MLSEVQKALLAIDERTYYGVAPIPEKNKPWDYIVFYRDSLSVAANGNSYTDEFEVAITREDFVPDELVLAVIDAINALPGCSVNVGSSEYVYTLKPNTNLTVEQLRLKCSHKRKRPV